VIPRSRALRTIAEPCSLWIFPASLPVVSFGVSHLLDLASTATGFCPFWMLDLADRTRVLARLGGFPGATLLLRLLRAPYYTGAVNRAGLDHVGYPGPNDGYADFSFGEALAPSEPGGIGGNLP
jgi:hypothetical protein